MAGTNDLLIAARFEDKLRTYWYLQVVLALASRGRRSYTSLFMLT